jgi:hypothetical protein
MIELVPTLSRRLSLLRAIEPLAESTRPEQYLPLVAAGLANAVLHPELFAQPQRHRYDERSESTRRVVQIGFQQLTCCGASRQLLA